MRRTTSTTCGPDRIRGLNCRWAVNRLPGYISHLESPILATIGIITGMLAIKIPICCLAVPGVTWTPFISPIINQNIHLYFCSSAMRFYPPLLARGTTSDLSLGAWNCPTVYISLGQGSLGTESGPWLGTQKIIHVGYRPLLTPDKEIFLSLFSINVLIPYLCQTILIPAPSRPHARLETARCQRPTEQVVKRFQWLELSSNYVISVNQFFFDFSSTKCLTTQKTGNINSNFLNYPK